MEEVVDSLKRRGIIVSFSIIPILLLDIRVCVKFLILQISNISRSKWNTLYVSTYVCTHMASPWLFSRTRVLLPFSSTMPTFTVNLVSLEWRVRVPFHPRCIRTFRERNEMDLPFRFDFFQKSCFPFQSKLTCKRKDRKFMHFSFFISLKIRSIYNFTFLKSRCSDFCFIH